jgi:hypothetical protein
MLIECNAGCCVCTTSRFRVKPRLFERERRLVSSTPRLACIAHGMQASPDHDPHLPGPFMALPGEADIRPDVYVGLDSARRDFSHSA